MKTKQPLQKKLSLNKDTITDLSQDDLKKIKGGAWTDICVYSDFSECTNYWIVCC